MRTNTILRLLAFIHVIQIGSGSVLPTTDDQNVGHVGKKERDRRFLSTDSFVELYTNKPNYACEDQFDESLCLMIQNTCVWSKRLIKCLDSDSPLLSFDKSFASTLLEYANLMWWKDPHDQTDQQFLLRMNVLLGLLIIAFLIYLAMTCSRLRKRKRNAGSCNCVGKVAHRCSTPSVLTGRRIPPEETAIDFTGKEPQIIYTGRIDRHGYDGHNNEDEMQDTTHVNVQNKF